MKRTIGLLLLTLLACTLARAQPSATDTTVDVGESRLHFRVIPGQGLPILFEAGGGDGGGVWDDILKPLAQITGATLITYDRAGYGQSQVVEPANDPSQHGLLNGMQGLEAGLKQLGFDGDVMLVAHSYGGFYAQVFAARHPRQVKAAVLVDANLACWFTPAFTAKIMADQHAQVAQRGSQTPGNYFQLVNPPATVEAVRNAPFPTTIPVIDLVAENPPGDAEGKARWAACHQQFAQAAPNREGVLAYGSGHYIFRDNPALVVHAIVKAYSQAIAPPQREQVLQRAAAYALTAANEAQRRLKAAQATQRP